MEPDGPSWRDERDGAAREGRGDPRPRATIRIRCASTARTRSARCASTGTTRSTPAPTTDDVVRVAGRVLLRRAQGKLVFATLRDGTGDAAAVREQGRARRRRVRALRRRDRPRRLGRRRGHGHEDQEGRALGQRHDVHAARRSRCARCPRSGTASPTPTRVTGSATSTSSPTTTPAACSTMRFAAIARDPRVPARARLHRGRDAGAAPDRRRRDRAAVRRRTTTRSTSTSTCASRPSCT